MSFRDNLLKFIREDVVMDDNVRVDEGVGLIDGGVLDSMGLMRVIGFIEEHAGVRIPDSEVVPENFQTVGSMERLIERLKGPR